MSVRNCQNFWFSFTWQYEILFCTKLKSIWRLAVRCLPSWFQSNKSHATRWTGFPAGTVKEHERKNIIFSPSLYVAPYVLQVYISTSAKPPSSLVLIGNLSVIKRKSFVRNQVILSLHPIFPYQSFLCKTLYSFEIKTERGKFQLMAGQISTTEIWQNCAKSTLLTKEKSCIFLEY